MSKAYLLLMFALLVLLGFLSRAGTGPRLTSDKNPESKIAEVVAAPQLSGPDRLCNVFGSVLGTYSGGGDPGTDVYGWKIFNPSNTQVFSRNSGDETITYTFSGSGTYRVELIVNRGGLPIYSGSLDVAVVLGPTISLRPSYSYCEGESVTMEALDPTSPNFSEYRFEWRNSSGTLVGSANELTVDYDDDFSVNFYFNNSFGDRECENRINTSTGKLADYSITASQAIVCPDLPTTLRTSPAILGTWKYIKNGESTPSSLGYSSSIQILPNQNLNGEGDYTIIFEPDPANNPSCLATKTIPLVYLPQPDFLVYPASDASDCDTFDGELIIQATTDLDYVTVEGLGITTPSITAGSTFSITGLKSGTYTLVGVLGPCSNAFGSYVPLANPPTQLIFKVEDIVGETCTANGKVDGSFAIRFQNPPSTGNYRIINEKGTLVEERPFTNASEIPISIPGGTYFVEVFDNLNCNIPESSEVLVPGLDQTKYTVPAELTICQSFELTPETSQALEFTMTFPDGTEETLSAGLAFTITQTGMHKILGVLPGQNLICPTETQFLVNLVDPVEFEPVLINQDCLGNMTYEADIQGRDPNSVIFRWYDENDVVVGTGQFFNPFSYGNFKLDVQPANSAACPFPPIDFEIKEPILEVAVTLESTKLCEYGPRAILQMESTFPEEITDIEWRRFDNMGNIEPLPQFNNQWQITADIAGIYEVAVFSRIPSISKDCELGRQTLDIDLIPDKVPFDVPTNLFICDPFSLVPDSATPLEFELTFPDGKVEVKDLNEAFILDQEGTYTLLGYDPNIKGPLCPDEKTIQVKVFEPVQFSPKLVDMSCTGEYHYTAEVINYPSDEVDYLWKDPSGNVVSSTSEFFSTTYGTFTLEIQPTGSIPCTITPISFILEVPALSIAASIVAETLCPDQPDAALRLETDFDLVATIEWWFTDLSSNQSMLSFETGKREILAKNEGTYQVRIFNEFGCLLGSDETFVARSTDVVRPELEESYQVCPKYEIAPALNPGSFAQYEWYFEDNLVSTSPTFKPLQIGTYYLIVVSQEGCAYETSFETTEECDLEVVFPNAIQPGNPDKQFLTYANFLVDEMEIWIFNKWGNLIFHCFQVNSAPGESACYWDGTFDGKTIPPGSYAVRINSRNIEKNLKNEQWEAILVID